MAVTSRELEDLMLAFTDSVVRSVKGDAIDISAKAFCPDVVQTGGEAQANTGAPAA